MTNGDKIRGMTDEELAKFLFERGNCSEYCYGICAYQDECHKVQDEAFCIIQIVQWLNQDQEADTLKIGDEVVFPFTGAKLVVYLNDSKRICAINQSNHYEGDGSSLIKTGRHFPQVAELFKAMKGEENG